MSLEWGSRRTEVGNAGRNEELNFGWNGNPETIEGIEGRGYGGVEATNQKNNPQTQSCFTNTQGMSNEEILGQIQDIKGSIGYNTATTGAKVFWDVFQTDNNHKLPVVLRLAEELKIRGATINEMFIAVVESGTSNIQANLNFMDTKRAANSATTRERVSPRAALTWDDSERPNLDE